MKEEWESIYKEVGQLPYNTFKSFSEKGIIKKVSGKWFIKVDSQEYKNLMSEKSKPKEQVKQEKIESKYQKTRAIVYHCGNKKEFMEKLEELKDAGFKIEVDGLSVCGKR